MNPKQEHVKHLLISAVTQLCKDGLDYDHELHMEGYLCISTDRSDPFVVNFEDTLTKTGAITLTPPADFGDESAEDIVLEVTDVTYNEVQPTGCDITYSPSEENIHIIYEQQSEPQEDSSHKNVVSCDGDSDTLAETFQDDGSDYHIAAETLEDEGNDYHVTAETLEEEDSRVSKIRAPALRAGRTIWPDALEDSDYQASEATASADEGDMDGIDMDDPEETGAVTKEEHPIKEEIPEIVDMSSEVILTPYLCIQCGSEFDSRAKLTRHMKTHKEEQSKPFKCPLCDTTFTNKRNMKTHLKRHEGIRPHVCNICDSGFFLPSELKTHMRTHSLEKNFKCTDCDKEFRSSAGLLKHMQKKTGERHPCPHCEKTFTERSNLMKHIKWIHEGVSAFVCLHCGKRFGGNNQLQRHIRNHTGELPYQCSYCGKRFKVETTLKIHLMIHTGETPYTCDQCGRGFRYAKGLVSHMRTHTGEKPFMCTQCGRRFSEKSNLDHHIRNTCNKKRHDLT